MLNCSALAAPHVQQTEALEARLPSGNSTLTGLFHGTHAAGRSLHNLVACRCLVPDWGMCLPAQAGCRSAGVWTGLAGQVE